MSMPERLRVWCDQSPHNQRIIVSLMEGVISGLLGMPIGKRAGELGITARSAYGDAFETGWEYSRHRSTVPPLPKGYLDTAWSPCWRPMEEPPPESRKVLLAIYCKADPAGMREFDLGSWSRVSGLTIHWYLDRFGDYFEALGWRIAAWAPLPEWPEEMP